MMGLKVSRKQKLECCMGLMLVILRTHSRSSESLFTSGRYAIQDFVAFNAM